MLLVPHLPHKAQYLLQFSFPEVTKLCQKSAAEQFVGGRKGYDRETLFGWLLVKKVLNWDYRTIASMAGISHSTLVRANSLFVRKRVYDQLFTSLVKRAYQNGLIKGKFVAMDSSFVHTFSKHGEMGGMIIREDLDLSFIYWLTVRHSFLLLC